MMEFDEALQKWICLIAIQTSARHFVSWQQILRVQQPVSNHSFRQSITRVPKMTKIPFLFTKVCKVNQCYKRSSRKIPKYANDPELEPNNVSAMNDGIPVYSFIVILSQHFVSNFVT